MHLQRTIDTRSYKSEAKGGGGGGASGNGLVFAAPSKRRILGDMQPTNGTTFSISIAPQSCRGNYLDHEKVVICNLICYLRIYLVCVCVCVCVCVLPPPPPPIVQFIFTKTGHFVH